MSSSLYEKLGGQDAVEAAVDKFYDKLLTDDRVKHFFDGIDMKRQRAHQKAFLTYAFGGPNNYKGTTMRDSHARLVKEMGLNDSHVDAVIEILGGVLKEMGVSDDLIAEVAGVAESVRDEVLGR